MPRHLERELQQLLFETVISLGNQARAAENLQVDQATLSRWINGHQGMDLGQCLRVAKLTQTPVVDVLRWAHHDPEQYLEAGNLPSLSADAQSISDRARLLSWERRRKSIPEEYRIVIDNTMNALLESFEMVYDALEPQ